MRVFRARSTARRCTSFTATFVAILFLAACGDQPLTAGKGDANDPWIVTVEIDSSNQCEILDVIPKENSCGLPYTPDICVKQGKSIRWVSDPAGTPFNIYFDPLVGQPHRALDGTYEKNIDQSAPPSRYKYTVTGPDVGPNKCDTSNQGEIFDPAIRVDKP